MNLGWIDFSDNDRKKTMDVLRLFQEQGAVDELGIGVIRDGFANSFFPGTSTIQTRAKYFFIIPYAMMDTVRDPHVSSVQQALRRLDEIEKESAVILKKNSDEQGIIGATVLPKWVVRTPSTIYWNGLRTLGIFNAGLLQNISISEEENNKDDVDAGDFLFRNFWHLPYVKNWKDELSIDLTPNEADYLAIKIKESNPKSVFAFVIRENIDIEQYVDFSSFSCDLKQKLDEENASMMELADRFNDFISIAQIRYNLMLSEGRNDTAQTLWEDVKSRASEYADSVDLEAVFGCLRLHNKDLKKFLECFKNAVIRGDWDVADHEILKQEVRIKGARAKLKNKSKYPEDKWRGGYKLDYRFTDARRLIMDIRKGGYHV